MSKLCPKCDSQLISVPEGLSFPKEWICPLDPKDCRIKELEARLAASEARIEELIRHDATTQKLWDKSKAHAAERFEQLEKKNIHIEKLEQQLKQAGTRSIMLAAHQHRMDLDRITEEKAALEAKLNAQVQHMVNRFLGWKLPDDFAPDAGISFDIEKCRYGPNVYFPSGTNLFHGGQAEAMIRYMLEGMPHE